MKTTTTARATNEELRRIDNWIARHVMGWRQDRDKYSWQTPGGVFTEWQCCPVPPAWRECQNNVFLPTIRAVAAMAVLKKVCESGFVAIRKSTDTAWLVTSFHDKSGFGVEAPTLEIAICKYAIRLHRRKNK